LLIKSIELEELLLLLVVVVGTDEDDDEDCQEDGETLHPSYIIIISTFINKICGVLSYLIKKSAKC
jgi:hypothetical protein